jgi:uncharacterized membrane protein YozB (DUF420 family)
VILLAAISTVLLLIAWLLWLKRGDVDKHAVQQGVLLAVLLAAWFLRIVLG